MKNSEWLELPIFNESLFPKEIRDIANRVGTSVEEIGRNEQVKPGCVLSEWIKREDIMQAFRIMQHPDNESMSTLLLLSGEELTVDMPHRKLMNKIHKFLMQKPQYDFEQGGEWVAVPIPNEGEQGMEN